MKPTINYNNFTKSIRTYTRLLYIVFYKKINNQFLPRACYGYDLIQLYFSAAVKINKVIVLHNEEEKLSAIYQPVTIE